MERFALTFPEKGKEIKCGDCGKALRESELVFFGISSCKSYCRECAHEKHGDESKALRRDVLDRLALVDSFDTLRRYLFSRASFRES